MASKIEKLRKLHADKVLDADELDNIAGGFAGESADDSRFLNVLLRGHPAQPDRYGEYKIFVDVANNSRRYAEIRAAWEVCGIAVPNMGTASANQYFCLETQKYISQDEAMGYAMNKMGKQLNRSDWYW